MKKIPISPTGKVNYQLLPEPGYERPGLEKTYVAPRTELENFLVKLWQDILGIKKIGIHDNFFELGGDSLKAAIFINRLQQELNEILYVVILFDAQSIAKLVEYLIKSYPQTIHKLFKIDV
jgi:acyl carrier protein